ncbi:MAG: putative ribosome biogenesis GTPase RsgA [Planctomycetota bacterium]|nr:MAG: putative ribosome biogenesis GTPase RsgA [Planctomycetota bacterium]
MTDFHKRSGKRRRQKDLDPFAHRRSPEENRELKRRAAERRKQHEAERRPRRRDWNAEDGAAHDAPTLHAQQGGPRRRPKRRRADPAEHESKLPREALLELVVCSPGRTQLLARHDDREVTVRIPPAWARSGEPWPVVGDEVLVAREGREGFVLAEVLPRAGVLTRGGASGAPRVLAAHVQLGVLVLSAEAGAYRPGLVDRACLALRRGGIDALVVLNKIDLVSAEQRAARELALADHLDAGLELLTVSATTGAGLQELRARVRGQRLVLFGHSGVGKSTLLNALDPEGSRRVGDVRAGDGKGRHTTTSSGLTRLADGTELIDTPGVRAFGLGRVRAEELDELFPQLAELRTRCRFNDCAHTEEPGCAVRAALASAELSAQRWERYGRLLRGQD